MATPRPKRRRDEPGGPPTANRQEEQRLYLIFDDYPWGYSVREINLPPPAPPSSRRSSHRKAASDEGGGGAARRLPRPIICFEALRGYPIYIAAVGTRIVATHPRDPFCDDSVPDGFLPIVDVRWRGVTFGPGRICQDIPIYIPFGDDALLALDTCNFRKLPMEPLWPPRLEDRRSSDAGGWSWRDLPRPPFYRQDVTSYVMHGQSIVFSVESDAEPTLDPDGETVLFSDEKFPATFTFDTASLVWEQRGEWVMPFAGRAFFVDGLQAFVGLSRDAATSGDEDMINLSGFPSSGHLCCCDCDVAGAGAAATNPPAWKLGKEKLFREDPAETHVGATLVYTGGSEFCLVQCVSIDIEPGGHGGDAAGARQDEEPRRRCCHVYRLTSFSVSYDDDGDLTTAGTCRVQCYKVPEETSQKFLRWDPVAFWL